MLLLLPLLQAVTEVINGLTSGAAAAQTTKARKVLEDKWKRLDWVKVSLALLAAVEAGAVEARRHMCDVTCCV